MDLTTMTPAGYGWRHLAAMLSSGKRMARRSWEGLAYIEQEGAEIYKVEPPSLRDQITRHSMGYVCPPNRDVYVPTASDLLVTDWRVVAPDEESEDSS
jgi:hypothetical protein